jgi:hypothetical protein
MSWSVGAIGKAPAVAAEIERQFNQSKCSEPEEGVRQAARSTIAAALAAQDPAIVVDISAYGSQSTDYKTNALRNQLTLKIEPRYGFIE